MGKSEGFSGFVLVLRMLMCVCAYLRESGCGGIYVCVGVRVCSFVVDQESGKGMYT